jgi:hypothetical protein
MEVSTPKDRIFHISLTVSIIFAFITVVEKSELGL